MKTNKTWWRIIRDKNDKSTAFGGLHRSSLSYLLSLREYKHLIQWPANVPYQTLAWSQLHVTHFDQRGQTLYDSPYSSTSTKSPFTVCKSMLFSLSWWTWRTVAWSSRFCFTVALKYVSSLRRALKLLSETHESFTKFVYTPLSARSLACGYSTYLEWHSLFRSRTGPMQREASVDSCSSGGRRVCCWGRARYRSR